MPLKYRTRNVSRPRVLKRRPPTVATKRYVKRTIDRKRETKHYIVSSSSTPAYDNTTVQDLTTIAEGFGPNDKDGQKCELRGLNIKGKVDANGAAILRMLVFQWFEDSTVDTPVQTDFFNTAADAHFENVNPIFNAGRYKVLYDKRVFVTNEAGVGKDIVQFQTYIPASRLARKMIKDKDASTTGKNHIYLLATSSVTDASGNEPTLKFHSVAHFKDA